MRIAVTGGRDYCDAARVAEALDAIHEATPLDILIHGDARGADTLAADWARRRGVPLDPYPARWDDLDALGARIRRGPHGFYNSAAGHQRNVRMLMLGVPHLVAVFPGGKGTAHCRGQALRLGIAVMDIDP